MNLNKPSPLPPRSSRYRAACLLLAAVALLALGTLIRNYGGTFNADFSSGTLPASGVTLNGYAYITNNATGIHLTDTGVGGSSGSIALDDLDAGGTITGFTADFDILLGNGAAGNADGFSFSFGSDVTSSSNLSEEGAGGPNDFTLEFDTYNNGGTDNIGIDVKQSGTEIALGPQYDLSFLYHSGFVHCTIQANNDTTVNVVFNGTVVYTNLFGAFLPTQGQFVLSARTGGANEDCFIKNLKITTINTAPAHPYLKSATPAPNSSGVAPNPTVTLVLSDTSTQVDPNSLVLTVNGTKVTPTVSKSGSDTTISFTPPALLPSKSTNSVSLAYGDTGTYKNTIAYTFVVGNYADLDPSFALTDAEAATAKGKPGFYVQLWGLDFDSQIFPNLNDFSDYALAGELGPNVGDLATGSYTDNSQIIPNLRDESATIDYASGAVPGVPTLAKGSANYSAAPTDNFAMAFYTALEFPTAGIYTLGVNSDDGFRTYIGTNLADLFQEGSIMAGEFNGGRGTADTLYRVNIQKPGLYPFRTTYEEGGGGYAVHWFSVNGDGTQTMINDSADPKAIKAYQWIAEKRAYIKSVTPGANVPFGLSYVTDSMLKNGVTIVVGDGSLTKYVSGSAKLIWNGKDVTSSLKVTSSGGLTTINYPITLGRATDNVAKFSYDESGTPAATRTVTFNVNVGPAQMSDLPASSFWIEAEDFNSKGTTVAAASTMPYTGGAFDSMPATWGVDYNNNDNFEAAALYRDEASADLGTGGKSVDITAQLANHWGTIRPGGVDMQSNYRIGWADSGEWYDYTRTIPAGVYTAYAGLSYGDFSANNMGGTLSIVTAGATTANQTVQDVGQFDSDGSGAWGQNSLVPMHSISGGIGVPGYVKLPGGSTTLRFTVRSGDYDFFILSPATGVPPAVTSGPNVYDSIRRDAALAFTLSDFSTAVTTSSVKLSVDGADVTSSTTVNKTGDITSVSYKPAGMFVSGAHNYVLTFSDGTTPQTVSNVFHVNPYPTPGTFVIEAEDFDYDGGKSNPLAGKAGYDVNVMPYIGGAYTNLDAVLGADYFNDDAADSVVYRTNLVLHVGHNVDIADNLGGRFGADRGTWTMTNNFKVGWINSGDWFDYTRTFPSGNFQVWAAMSHGDALGTAHDLRGSLDVVSSGAGTTNQTLKAVGIFDAPSSGAWSRNELVPMTDTNGVVQVVSMGGAQTVRFNADSGDFDYFLFVPSTGSSGGNLQIGSVSLSSGQIKIQWSDAAATLQSSSDLKAWTDLTGAVSPYSAPSNGKYLFYRLKK